MIIIRDERNEMETAQLGICEDCKKEKLIRRIKSKGDRLGGASRGYFDICYDCLKPKILWKDTPRGMIFESDSPKSKKRPSMAGGSGN